MEAARIARPDDIDRIVELSGAMRAELSGYRGGDLWARTQPTLALEPSAVRIALDDPDACVVVGTIDNTIIGFGTGRVIWLSDGGRLGEITELFVEPGAREVSVGETMIASLTAWCADHGCVGVDATALPGHRAAKNFFEDQGFIARSLTMHHSLVPDPEA